MAQGSLFAAGTLCVLLVSSAAAAPGVAGTDVNMRAGPGVRFPVIVTIPGGAPVEVFECGSWCKIGYAGCHGFVAAGYILGGYTPPAPRAYYEPVPVYETPVLPPVGYPVYEETPWVVAPPRHWRGHVGHYRRGDGAYFEFGF